MEARRFGFDPSLPPAFKFDPTDADLVAYYLLPRVLNLPNPHAHAIVDADPASCPPWELLRRNGRAGSEQAFFFAPPREVSQKGEVARTGRGVPAAEDGGVPGLWRGQKGQDERLVLLLPGGGGGGEIVVTYRKFSLTYYNDLGVGKDGKKRTSLSGWVMHEFMITDPLFHPAVVLARVKLSDRELSKEHGKKWKKAAATAVQMPFVPPYQDQPGPSSSYYGDYHHADGGQAAGPSSNAQFSVVQQSNDEGGDDNDVGEPVASYTGLLLGEGIGSLVDENNNYIVNGMGYAYFNPGMGYTAAPEHSNDGGSSNGYYHTATGQQHDA